DAAHSAASAAEDAAHATVHTAEEAVDKAREHPRELLAAIAIVLGLAALAAWLIHRRRAADAEEHPPPPQFTPPYTPQPASRV
ncbi:MAG TPA: hypothetical protein VFZ89_19305, partial [Solirubrobacteraceae bacterium]